MQCLLQRPSLSNLISLLEEVVVRTEINERLKFFRLNLQKALDPLSQELLEHKVKAF